MIVTRGWRRRANIPGIVEAGLHFFHPRSAGSERGAVFCRQDRAPQQRPLPIDDLMAARAASSPASSDAEASTERAVDDLRLAAGRRRRQEQGCIRGLTLILHSWKSWSEDLALVERALHIARGRDRRMLQQIDAAPASRR